MSLCHMNEGEPPIELLEINIISLTSNYACSRPTPDGVLGNIHIHINRASIVGKKL